MAIDRGPWNALVDDDGSNLVGTIWNKDKIKTVILDPTDAALAAIPPAVPPIVPTYGAWTPVDVSGAGLVFAYALATYSRFDRWVFITMQIVYPATSNGLSAKIGGLPAVVSAPGGGACQGYGVLRSWHLPENLSELHPIDLTTGGFSSNASMSGLNVKVTAVYLTV